MTHPSLVGGGWWPYCIFPIWPSGGKLSLSAGGLCNVFSLFGFNASATARVISRRRNDDDDEISFLVEETGVPGGNHRLCNV